MSSVASSSASAPGPTLQYDAGHPLLVELQYRFLKGNSLHEWELDALRCCLQARMIRQSVPGSWIVFGMGALIGPLMAIVFPAAVRLSWVRFGKFGWFFASLIALCVVCACGFVASLFAYLRGNRGPYLVSKILEMIVLAPLLFGGFAVLTILQLLGQRKILRLRQSSFAAPAQVWTLAKPQLKQIMQGNEQGWFECPQNQFQARPPYLPRLRFFDNGVLLLRRPWGDACFIRGDAARGTPIQRDSTNRAFVEGWIRHDRPYKRRVWLSDEAARTWESWASAAGQSDLKSQSPDFTIQFTCTFEDFAQSQRVLGRNPTRNLVIIVSILLFLSIPTLLAPASILLGWSVFLLLIIVAAIRAHMQAVPRSWRANPPLARRKTVTTNSNSLTIADDLTRNEMRWEHFASFREGPDVFIVMPTSQAFYMIPKRAFVSAAEVDRFRDLLRRRINQRRLAPLKAEEADKITK